VVFYTYNLVVGCGKKLTEKQNAPKISAALSVARACMRKGRSEEAVDVLEVVRPLLSFGTITGGTCFLELGMALEACSRPKDALQLYQKLVAQTGDEGIRKQVAVMRAFVVSPFLFFSFLFIHVCGGERVW
jgi:hypothetical protein